MRSHVRIGGIALLATIAMGSLSDVAWAQRSGRAVVAGRQQIRMKLAAALADGELSRMEQYSILLKGQRVLNSTELAGLQRTLNRLATRQAAASATGPFGDESGSTYVDRSISVQEVTEPPAADGGEPAEEDSGQQDAVDAETLHATEYEVALATSSQAEQSPAEGEAETVSYADPAIPPADENPFQDESAEVEQILVEEDGTTVDLFGDEGIHLAAGASFTNLLHGSRPNMNDIRLTTTVDAFKGPLDLDNRNGNFGINFAVNAGFPLAQQRGIGVQAGTSAVLSDFHGTQFTGGEVRSQNFTTVGLFQRSPMFAPKLKWGFAYDWLYDDYYSTLKSSQWRVKLAYDLSPFNEIGLWTCIPNDGDSAAIGTPPNPITYERFKPVAQGDFYFRHWWQSGTSTTAWIGIVEEPGEFVFGCDARVPISPRLAFVGNLNYVLPSATGIHGQDEEMWNVSMGIEFVPKLSSRCHDQRFTPLLPLANNGTFAFRRY